MKNLLFLLLAGVVLLSGAGCNPFAASLTVFTSPTPTIVLPTVTSTLGVYATPTYPPQEQTVRDIYTLLIDGAPPDIFGPDTILYVRNPTMIWDMDSVIPYDTIQVIAPQISPELWNAFRNKNQEAIGIPNNLSFSRKVAWITIEYQKELFTDYYYQYEAWLRFNSDLGGYRLISQIEVSPTNNFAFAVVRTECGFVCSRGELVLFAPDNDKWQETERISLWDENNPKPDIDPTTLALPPITPTPLPVFLTSAIDTERLAIEIEVYTTLFTEKDLFGFIADTIVVEDTTNPYSSYFIRNNVTVEGELNQITAEIPTTQVATWYDFVNQNYTSYRFSEALKFGRPTIFIRDGELESIFEDTRNNEDGGWSRFYEAYPNSNGISRVSRVGFNTTRTQAIVYITAVCGDLCLTSALYVYEKQNNQWIRVGDIILAQS